MEPTTIAALVGLAVGLTDECVKIARGMMDYRARFKETSQTLMVIVAYCRMMQASTGQVQAWIANVLSRMPIPSDNISDLQDALEAMLGSLKRLDSDVAGLLGQERKAYDMSANTRLRCLWNEDRMRTHLQQLHILADGLQLLLTTTLLPAHDVHSVLEVLSHQDKSTDASRRSIISNEHADPCWDLPSFQDDLFSSQVYQRAFLRTFESQSWKSLPISDDERAEIISVMTAQLEQQINPNRYPVQRAGSIVGFSHMLDDAFRLDSSRIGRSTRAETSRIVDDDAICPVLENYEVTSPGQSPNADPRVLNLELPSPWHDEMVLFLENHAFRGLPTLVVIMALAQVIAFEEHRLDRGDPNDPMTLKSLRSMAGSVRLSHYFDIISGVRTTGLHAILLSRLRLNVTQTIRSLVCAMGNEGDKHSPVSVKSIITEASRYSSGFHEPFQQHKRGQCHAVFFIGHEWYTYDKLGFITISSDTRHSSLNPNVKISSTMHAANLSASSQTINPCAIGFSIYGVAASPSFVIATWLCRKQVSSKSKSTDKARPSSSTTTSAPRSIRLFVSISGSHGQRESEVIPKNGLLRDLQRTVRSKLPESFLSPSAAEAPAKMSALAQANGFRYHCLPTSNRRLSTASRSESLDETVSWIEEATETYLELPGVREDLQQIAQKLVKTRRARAVYPDLKRYKNFLNGESEIMNEFRIMLEASASTDTDT